MLMQVLLSRYKHTIVLLQKLDRIRLSTKLQIIVHFIFDFWLHVVYSTVATPAIFIAAAATAVLEWTNRAKQHQQIKWTMKTIANNFRT